MRTFLIGLTAIIALNAMIAAIVIAAPLVSGDLGPKADIVAVRSAQHQLAPNDHVRKVHVVGDYALLGWYRLPEGDGALKAFKRVSGERWKAIGGSGGVITRGNLVQWGIPESVARQLCSGFPNACTSK